MKKWKETEKRYICFVDVMGFSDFVYRNSHESVKKRMTKLRNIISQNESIIRAVAAEKDGENDAIRTVIFSDSVLIFTIDDSVHSLENILLASQTLLCACFLEKIPVKGAISYGTITADFDKSLYFGKGLIDAYHIESIVEMYGIVLDNKIEDKIIKTRFDCTPYCCTKKVPTKTGHIRHIAIDWMNFFEHMDIKNKNPVDLVENFYTEVSGTPRKYVDNTIDFIKSQEFKAQ